MFFYFLVTDLKEINIKGIYHDVTFLECKFGCVLLLPSDVSLDLSASLHIYDLTISCDIFRQLIVNAFLGSS